MFRRATTKRLRGWQRSGVNRLARSVGQATSFKANLHAVAALAVALWGGSLLAQDTAQVARQLNLSVPEVQGLQRLSGYSMDYLARMPVDALARVERRIRYPDIQRLRAGYDAVQYGIAPGAAADEALAQGARWRAAEQFRSMQLETRRAVSAGIPVGQPEKTRGAGLSQGAWQWLGPGNVGGRTRAIVVHPQKPDTIWLGSVGGGVWRSDNGGQQWQPLESLLSNLVISCLVMQPGQPDCLLAGTGEGLGRNDMQADLRGDGIFITRDGGTTWSQLAATKGPDFAFVNRLAFSADGKVLLAATSKGIFRSADLGGTWKRTADFDAADVDFHPKDANQAIAGTYDSGKIFVSADGGATWKPSDLAPFNASRFEGRVELCYATADPNVAYAVVNVNNGTLCRSTDGGRSFSVQPGMKDVFGPNRQGQYDSAIWAGDPSSAEVIVIGGLDLHKSGDGGKSFQAISYWPVSKSSHADQHVITAHPGYDGVSNRTLFVGNDGGIYKMTDLNIAGQDNAKANGWVNLNTGYGVTQFYDAAGHPGTGIIIGGAQDNGTFRYQPQDGPNKWHRTYGGDGGFCAVDPSNPRVIYGQYVFLEIFRSDDAGFDGDQINGIQTAFFGPSDSPGQTRRWKSPPLQIRDSREQGRKCNFIAPYILDPSDPNRVLAGGWSLWRSNNAKAKVAATGGPEWFEIKPALGNEPSRGKLSDEEWQKLANEVYGGYPISAIAVAPGDSETIWVGHNNGQVYKTTTGTAKTPQWTQLGKDMLPGRWCHSIAVSPHDKNRVYLGFVGFTRDNLWMTADGGTTWKNLGAKLPEGGVRSIAIHPKNPNWIYIGTDSGVLTSEDGGTTFDPVNAGPALVRVSKLFWMGDKLTAATYGRGIYTAEIKGP